MSGSIIWFVARSNITRARYTNPESVIWRDAGALLATICLAATALNLVACPIGASGEPFIRRLLAAPDHVYGVGACAIGHA